MAETIEVMAVDTATAMVFSAVVENTPRVGLGRSNPPKRRRTRFEERSIVPRDRWVRDRDSDSRVLVVLRDPRSLLGDGTDSGASSINRELADLSPRERQIASLVRVAELDRIYRSWAQVSSTQEQVIRLEEVLHDPELLVHALEALGADDPARIVQTLSDSQEGGFDAMARDLSTWRGAVERPVAALFETTFPGLLTQLGYETGSAWWRSVEDDVAEEQVDVAVATSTTLFGPRAGTAAGTAFPEPAESCDDRRPPTGSRGLFDREAS